MNNKLLNLLFGSQDNIAPLLLRIPLGIILMAHGAQKLFGWFGGYGLEATGNWMASIGFAPGFLMALLAGSAEFFGGLALLIGIFTRPAAIVCAFTMAMAMTVHIGNGLFVSNQGYEFALILLAASAYLGVIGGGQVSADRVIRQKLAL